MNIIMDAMGGDHAPEAPVLGAIQAAKDFGSHITLVGRGEEILNVLRKNNIEDLPKGIEIANAEEIVDMHDDPARVIQKKKNSSMVVGLRMLAEGQGDAFISAGSTGAHLHSISPLSPLLSADSHHHPPPPPLPAPCGRRNPTASLQFPLSFLSHPRLLSSLSIPASLPSLPFTPPLPSPLTAAKEAST